MGHPDLPGPHLTQSKGRCPSVAEDLARLPALPTKPPCPTPRLSGHTPGLSFPGPFHSCARDALPTSVPFLPDSSLL